MTTPVDDMIATLEAIGYREGMRGIIDAMMQSARAAAPTVPDGVWQAREYGLQEGLVSPRAVAAVAALYCERLSPEDIAVWRTWAESPVGQRTVAAARAVAPKIDEIVEARLAATGARDLMGKLGIEL